VETRSADWAVLVEAARVMKLEQEFVRADNLQADVSRILRASQARTQQGRIATKTQRARDKIARGISIGNKLLPAGWRASRSFPVHWFGPILGIIGTQPYSRKVAYWPCLHDCVIDSIESVNNSAAFSAARVKRRGRSCALRAARSWEQALRNAISAARA
jgi:hypothetical protein